MIQSAMVQSSINNRFILSLPKAELHLHLEGTVSPQTLSELSQKHNTPMPGVNNRYAADPTSGNPLTVAEVERLYQYTNFQGFLMAFKAVTERLRDPEDYELITYRMLQQLRDENVLHAEAYKVADEAVAYRERQLASRGESSVVGIGIGGDEQRGAPEMFRNAYRYA